MKQPQVRKLVVKSKVKAGIGEPPGTDPLGLIAHNHTARRLVVKTKVKAGNGAWGQDYPHVEN